MTEREFWIAVRQALLMFVSAIERRYKLGKYSDGQTITDSSEITTYTIKI